MFFFIFLTLFFYTNAFAVASMGKAKEFMQAGMFPQAAVLLQKEIMEKPTNAEAHFLLAICYMNQGNFLGADERFASVIRLDPEYGYKIGSEYMKVGKFMMDRGRVWDADAYFKKAITYQPNLKNDIGDIYFQFSQQKEGKEKEKYFEIASKYNSKYKKMKEDQERERIQDIQRKSHFIIGKWKDENSVLIYKEGGTGQTLFDNGESEDIIWSVDGDIITKTHIKQNKTYKYKILDITHNSYKYKSLQDGRIWNAQRVQ